MIIDDTYSFINNSDTHNQHSLSSFTVNELELKNLERSDLNSVLECQAFNNNISSPVSSSVVLDINCKLIQFNLLHTHSQRSESFVTPKIMLAIRLIPQTDLEKRVNIKNLK